MLKQLTFEEVSQVVLQGKLNKKGLFPLLPLVSLTPQISLAITE